MNLETCKTIFKIILFIIIFALLYPCTTVTINYLSGEITEVIRVCVVALMSHFALCGIVDMSETIVSLFGGK